MTLTIFQYCFTIYGMAALPSHTDLTHRILREDVKLCKLNACANKAYRNSD